ncbi:uncharacterized protein LOC143152302 [Ptiloglossa arizonensis]|uniref:uncharacterized protein LOC143152302 n=1 Tax=Ptiloglossa arizonensis TaxID=3350558 RepID=UPI003FA14B63
MSSEEGRPSTPASSGHIDESGHNTGRRMSHFKEYKFFRSFSAKVENWPMRKAEALWRRMRERKIAGKHRPITEHLRTVVGSETLNRVVCKSERGSRCLRPHARLYKFTSFESIDWILLCLRVQMRFYK